MPPAPRRDPPSAALLHRDGTVLFDTARTDDENRLNLLFSAPERVIRADRLGDVPGALAEVDAAVRAGRHVAGYLAYEAGYAFEEIGGDPEGTGPLLWFGVYGAPARLSAAEVDALTDAAGAYEVGPVRFDLDGDAYRAAIGRIREHIREGDVYQVNYTGRLRFGFAGDPAGLYGALRREQRVAYGVYLRADGRSVLSFSPELFFRREGEHVTTRPMKGTIRRGRTPNEDEALAGALARDEKNRAENLMIVDLLRNDLSICCRPGTVRVPHLFSTERYETVTQMTSTVEGLLRPGVGYAELFRALFPCGSVTGAPKIRAMRLIRSLEQTPRGVYCGAIGYIEPGGRAVFNVAIRTVVLGGDTGEMGVGSGIVWDSDPAAEYEECLLKGRFLTGRFPPAGPAAEFVLIETMAWEGGVALLALHAERMRASAERFGFPFDAAAFRRRIEQVGAELDPRRRWIVRATLDAAGRLETTTAPLEAGGPGPLRLMLAEEPLRCLPSDEPLRYHKTSRRAAYEAAYRRAREAGCDEAIFVNERGELTEGSRTNLFVRREGVLWTPPVSCGLLGGVYRRHLLETRADVKEGVLRPEDLRTADALYVSNAVHGLRPAVYVEPSSALP